MHSCIPSHGLKISGCIMSKRGECLQQQHTQHAPSAKTECDYLYGWIKKKIATHTKKTGQGVLDRTYTRSQTEKQTDA